MCVPLPSLPPGRRFLRALANLCAPLLLASAVANPTLAGRITSLAALKQIAAEQRTPYAITLDATVWYADPTSGHLILHDESGTAEIHADLGDLSLQPGDRVAVSGAGTLLSRGSSFELARLSLVDNDGLHFETERSGSLRLEAGRHPVRLDWFNAGLESRLTLEYSGPGFARRPIPDAALVHPAAADGAAATDWRPGLEYRTFPHRQWLLPPHQNASGILQRGTTANFDCAVAGSREYTGADFSGYLEVATPGEYRFFLRADDGARLFVGPSSLRLERLEPVAVPAPRALSPGQVLSPTDDYVWARIEGRISRAIQIGRLQYLSLESGAGQVRVEVAEPAGLPGADLLNRLVRITGVVRRNCASDGLLLASTLFLQNAGNLEFVPAAAGDAEVVPVGRIERFNRETLGGHPLVRIRGVVTRVISGVRGVVLQDQTRGIYVDLNELAPGPIQIGDLLEVGGNVEAGEFSPFIIARELVRLGAGVMPEPIEATREEIVNGSLHSQYVEIEGYVLAVDPRAMMLRTRAGVLRIEIETGTSDGWLDAVVRLRGCLRVFWDADSRQITVGKVGLDYAEVSIERPAPHDPFAVAAKRAAELLRFDPYAEVFRRTKLAGQVLRSRGAELCLLDEGRGIRVTLTAPAHFTPGDLVEVAGFPEFDGPAPHFAHAVARRVGQAPLAPARLLASDDLLRDELDATLVTVEAEVIGTGFQEGQRTLRLRTGAHTFVARFDTPLPEDRTFAAGSRLRLTGVYGGLGGNRALSRPVEAFEVVLAAADRVEVLATPPWWTLARLLTLVGFLGFGLLVAFLWITILRRQVTIQTRQLENVLQERHRVQQEEALARERARLAHDLHDELGAGLSEIGLLGALADSPVPAEKREGYRQRLSETVRRLIASLDEIVWAVNPRYDPVASFVGYYTAYAQQYLGLAALRCRLDIAEDLPPDPLSSRVRHTLFLAFKEALTNVVKHAGATEVIIRIFIDGRRLVVSVADDGRGLGETGRPGMDGLDGIRARLQQLEGECVVESHAGAGTRIDLKVPLP